MNDEEKHAKADLEESYAQDIRRAYADELKADPEHWAAAFAQEHDHRAAILRNEANTHHTHSNKTRSIITELRPAAEDQKAALLRDELAAGLITIELHVEDRDTDSTALAILTAPNIDEHALIALLAAWMRQRGWTTQHD